MKALSTTKPWAGDGEKSSVYSRAPTTKKGLNAVEAASTYPVRGLLFLISKNCVPV